MKFDFDRVTDRKNTNSLKGRRRRRAAMWVADMDFEAAPAIRAAVENVPRTGYSATP